MKKNLLPLATLALFLSPSAKADSKPSSQKMPWEDPSYQMDIPATRATPRPEEGEGGWTLWMKHHQNRVRWVADQKVDLLMIGDSIVFRWGRNGKEVWDQYYANRNAVNIGSSGDKTRHMLWHLRNGGLAGMKNHNPKLVLLMIGTNNRGIPELKGYDTAYGILALLKEIHAQLPKSKILLMPIFPRGKDAGDVRRQANEEVNEIIKTYVDHKTVHWLDLRSVFINDDGTLKKDLMPDGLHPDKKGFQAWAEAMEPTIKKMLGEAP